MVRRFVGQEEPCTVNINMFILDNIIEFESGIRQAILSESVKVAVKMIINNTFLGISDYADDMRVNELGYGKSAPEILFVNIIIAEISQHIDRVISRRLLIPDPDLLCRIFIYIFERTHVADQDVI